jgi:hypothetical protein
VGVEGEEWGLEEFVKIDFPDIKNPDGLLFVRLYEFQRQEVQKLKETFEALAAGTLKHVTLEKMMPVMSVDGSVLTFTHNKNDKGVIKTGPLQFDFCMSSEGWLQAAALTEVFCDCASTNGFQWLSAHASGRIDLLLSPNGDW